MPQRKKTKVKGALGAIVDKGFRSTSQRRIILDEFMSEDTHFTVEELHARVRKKLPRVGFATVYRTLKLLVQAGIANELRFKEGVARYEQIHDQEHHDHLICISCGKIIEFENDQIEEIQVKMAREKGFQVLSHKLELYGRCGDCWE